MEARAQARYVRVTPRKARRVVDLIRGMQAAEASGGAAVRPSGRERAGRARCSRAPSPTPSTTTSSTADTLVVRRAYVDEGPTLKRFRPRAQGRAYRINKRTSHITVVVESRPRTARPAGRQQERRTR